MRYESLWPHRFAVQIGTRNKGNVKKRNNSADKLYLILFAVFGCVYMAFCGGWRIYAKSLQELKSGAAELLGWEQEMEQQDEEGEFLLPAAEDGGAETEGIEPVVPQAEEGGDGEEITPGEIVYETVDDPYFEDAVFIGDSRVMGMYEYGGLEEVSTFYAATGLSVYKMFTASVVPVSEQQGQSLSAQRPLQRKKITIEEALQERRFGKIYLMIGINEMGTGTVESFLDKYAECVAHLRELQPEAVIYLQSILKVTRERSAQGDYITNEGIDLRNEGIAALADGEKIFYLDVNQAVCDETGAMPEGYTYDGVHLKAQYISLWKEFLKEHAVVLPD